MLSLHSAHCTQLWGAVQEPGAALLLLLGGVCGQWELSPTLNATLPLVRFRIIKAFLCLIVCVLWWFGLAFCLRKNISLFCSAKHEIEAEFSQRFLATETADHVSSYKAVGMWMPLHCRTEAVPQHHSFPPRLCPVAQSVY